MQFCSYLYLFSLQDKHRRLDSPKSELDENEMLNMRSGSPERRFFEEKGQPSPVFNSEESIDSEYSSDRSKNDDRNKQRSREFRKGNKKNKIREHHSRNKKRDRDRDKKNNEEQDQMMKDSQGICVFYLQGKCLKVSRGNITFIFDLSRR